MTRRSPPLPGTGPAGMDEGGDAESGTPRGDAPDACAPDGLDGPTHARRQGAGHCPRERASPMSSPEARTQGRLGYCTMPQLHGPVWFSLVLPSLEPPWHGFQNTEQEFRGSDVGTASGRDLPLAPRAVRAAIHIVGSDCPSVSSLRRRIP